jgi:hypothetical protein
MFENTVLRKVSGTKRDEVIGEYRRLHNKELYDQVLIKYYLGDQIKKSEMGKL